MREGDTGVGGGVASPSHFIADFFIELDHANGPITMHCSIDGAVRYVRAGLQKLRQRDVPMRGETGK